MRVTTRRLALAAAVRAWRHRVLAVHGSHGSIWTTERLAGYGTRVYAVISLEATPRGYSQKTYPLSDCIKRVLA